MISTERLLLRQVSGEDKDFIIDYLADEEHAQYLPLERPYTYDEALRWFNGRLLHWRQYNFGTFIIILEHSKKILGYCGIEYVRDTQFRDIRYGLTKQFWGNGFAFEAALAVMQYGFKTLGFEKLYGAAVPQNVSSIMILKKLGMTEDDTFQVYGEEVAHYSLNVFKYNKIITKLTDSHKCT